MVKSKYRGKMKLTKKILILLLTLSCISHGTGQQQQTKKMRALYIPNFKAANLSYIKQIVEKGAPLGINMLVIDIHKYGSRKFNAKKEVIDYLKNEGLYIVARVVCFQDGITKMPVADEDIEALRQLIASSAASGFDEVQLDYIRFSDGADPYPLKKKYLFIESLLSDFKKIAQDNKIKLSADLFGRIVYNQNDYIGQKVEIFTPHVDAIYPMLYPSHYTGDRLRMSSPGETVKEGTLKGLKRTEGKIAVQPYIQAFPYNIQYAKVSLAEYVLLQIQAVEETEARGWVAWNPNGDYSSVFSALEKATKKD